MGSWFVDIPFNGSKTDSIFFSGAQGAKLTKLELNKRATISSSKAATVQIVPAPGWKELRANVITT